MNKPSNLNPWAPKRWNIADYKATSTLPKVTVGILNHNRCEDLRRTLDCISQAVEYPDIEVIVVDNGSDDGSVNMVRKEYPQVRIIALPENIGTSARNHFYEQANGKYVFSFDDDSFPATPSTIWEVVNLLELQPQIDSLTLFCYQPLTGHTETGEFREIYTSGPGEKGNRGLPFAEGAMCIRSSSWKLLSGYDPDFFWGGEGLDLTLQMYALRMTSMYHPGLGALHMKSGQNRNLGNNYYFFTRNHIWSLSKHFPFYAGVPLILLYILRKLITIAFNSGSYKSYMKGIKDGLIGIPKQTRKNKKLSLRQVIALKRWYFYLLRW
ncbi:MAG: glycosyltransferase [Ignavibacteriota bacterium]